MAITKLVLEVGAFIEHLSNIMSARLPFEYPMKLEILILGGIFLPNYFDIDYRSLFVYT